MLAGGVQKVRNKRQNLRGVRGDGVKSTRSHIFNVYCFIVIVYNCGYSKRTLDHFNFTLQYFLYDKMECSKPFSILGKYNFLPQKENLYARVNLYIFMQS